MMSEVRGYDVLIIFQNTDNVLPIEWWTISFCFARLYKVKYLLGKPMSTSSVLSNVGYLASAVLDF